MNYTNIYNRLIQHAKLRCIDPKQYYEKHHIIPKSLGGDNTQDNLIFLTGKEHYVAHHLLYKIYKNKEMTRAFYLMSTRKNVKITASTYNLIKQQFSKDQSSRMSGENNHYFNRSLTQEHKDKISKGNKGKRLGCVASDSTREKLSIAHRGKERTPCTDETKLKISESNKGNIPWNKNKTGIYTEERLEKMRSRVISPETRQKMSKARKNIKQSHESNMKRRESMLGKSKPRYKCIHCGNLFAAHMLKRYHNDNCRFSRVQK